MTIPLQAVLLLATALAVASPAAGAAAEWIVDFETGVVAATRNDVRIPGDTGTRLSLTDDLGSRAAPYARTRVGARVAERHTLLLTWAPLRLEARGVLPREVRFAGETFASGSEVAARYVFDSYRATWRYAALRSARLDLEVGATAFVRDASVSLRGARSAEKANVGFVPLVSFRAAWRPAAGVALVLDGDALAAPQGRAEDVLAAVELEARPGLAIRAGYRLIEGGADGRSVYTFALLNHLGIGISARL